MLWTCTYVANVSGVLHGELCIAGKRATGLYTCSDLKSLAHVDRQVFLADVKSLNCCFTDNTASQTLYNVLL